MITDSDIIAQFKRMDLSSFVDPSELNVLEQSLWVLLVVKDKLHVKALSASAIRNILSEVKEIDISEKGIIRAFARGKGKTKCHRQQDGIFYEIMSPGRTHLLNLNRGDTDNEIQFFTGKECWSDASIRFPRLIEKLTGDLCVLDPYYGQGTFYVLQKFGKGRKIRFLTRELGRKERSELPTFRNEFQRFRMEFSNVEFREIDHDEEVHDRYIIAQNALLVVGHGIKDIGTKESFVVYLPHEKVKGFLPTLKRVFEDRWARAAALTL